MTATKSAYLVEQLKIEFAAVDSIGPQRAIELIAILESAEDQTLRMIYAARVKFCWLLARRILADRNVYLELLTPCLDPGYPLVNGRCECGQECEQYNPNGRPVRCQACRDRDSRAANGWQPSNSCD